MRLFGTSSARWAGRSEQPRSEQPRSEQPRSEQPRSEQPRPDRAIVVFGAALDDAGRPGAGLTARLQQALRLAEAHPAALVLVSGGAVSHDKPEADAMAEWLIARGLEPARILREPHAGYTLDNAEKVAPMLTARGIRHVELVTEQFHMARSEAVMRGALVARGAQVELRTSAAPNALLDPARDAREVDKRARDLRNQAGLHGFRDRVPFGATASARPVREWWA